MKETLEFLTNITPPRRYPNVASLDKVANYLKERFENLGLSVCFKEYEVEGNIYKNVVATLNETYKYNKRLIIGAHYDVCGDTQGADDNGSGIAGVVESAKRLVELKEKLPFCVEFVCFTLEEPPHFGKESMGSYQYAHYLKQNNIEVIGMINYEMIGYFTNDNVDLSQFAPFITKNVDADITKGDFIAFVSDEQSNDFLSLFDFEKCKKELPLIEAMIPTPYNRVTASDHLNFWDFGYKAIMVTDTAYFRNKNYHTLNDTYETVDIDKIGLVIDLVVNGLLHFVENILKNDPYLMKLANIYVDNCSISISTRTVAHDFAMEYLQKYYLFDFNEAVDYFDVMMDTIDVSHREYDITCYRDVEAYNRLKLEIQESYEIEDIEKMVNKKG